MNGAMTNKRQRNRSGWIGFLASKYITLSVVVLLGLLSLVGARVPQQGIADVATIRDWQQAHPLATRILLPPGFFSTFQSPLFLLALLVLFINTLACSYKSIFRDRLFPEANLSARLRRAGFLMLHLGILVCMIGGFISAAFRMSGGVLITEGQTISLDQDGAYRSLVQGPLRAEKHDPINVGLVAARLEPPKRWVPGQKFASVRLSDELSPFMITDIDFNHPVTYKNYTFTLRDVGFAPHIRISSERHRFPPWDGFVALKIWVSQGAREDYDYIPLPPPAGRLSIKLYPAHELRDGKVVKTSDTQENPVILVSQEYPNGAHSPVQAIEPGQSVLIGDLRVHFDGLRQWAGFLVVDDPGYRIVCLSLGLAIIALGLRYIPDVLDWINEVRCNGKS